MGFASFHSTKEGFKAGAYELVQGPRICFHSTKEGFKEVNGVQVGVYYRQFPFHQGRFQGGDTPVKTYGGTLFPFHQGRVQGALEIPVVIDWVLFPFHQGRFQGF